MSALRASVKFDFFIYYHTIGAMRLKKPHSGESKVVLSTNYYKRIPCQEDSRSQKIIGAFVAFIFWV